MDDLALLADLHVDGERQGPGGDAETRLALAIAGLGHAPDLRVADIGCGTGASTLALAEALGASITAVDLIPAFLDTLRARADARGLGGRIETVCASMDALPFADSSYDVLWSEGAIYNIGFERGARLWRRFLRPGGLLVVSELTWLDGARPRELEEHWEAQYPEVGTASAKFSVLERAGYTPTGYFPLPRRCWMEGYYLPLQARFAAFLRRNGDSQGARAIVAAEQHEMALYERHAEHVGYGVYLARRTADTD